MTGGVDGKAKPNSSESLFRNGLLDSQGYGYEVSALRSLSNFEFSASGRYRPEFHAARYLRRIRIPVNMSLKISLSLRPRGCIRTHFGSTPEVVTLEP